MDTIEITDEELEQINDYVSKVLTTSESFCKEAEDLGIFNEKQAYEHAITTLSEYRQSLFTKKSLI